MKSLNNEGQTEVRDDTDDEDCPTHFESMMAPCPPQVFTECYTLTVAAMYDCSGVGGGFGGGNNGGNNNGNNTGGSTGNGNGNGNGTGNTYTPPNFWDVMAGQIPLEIFLQQNGTLPEGFSVQLFQQFIDIYNYFRNLGQYLSQPQLQWLEDHPDFVSIIWHILSVPEVGDERALIKPVLAFALQLNLNAAQYQFLVHNGAVFQAMQTFLVQHQNNTTAVQIVRALLVFVQNLADLTLNELNFLYDNFDGIVEATSEPTNPPITASRLICADILDFATLTDAQNGFQYTGMHLTDGYYAFTIPGLGPQNPFHIRDMHMIVNANSTNISCLPSTASTAADAINLAVSQTQQLFNNLPPTPPSADVKSAFKAALLRSIDREFRNIVKSCNSLNTSSVYVYAFGSSNPGDGLPRNNIDVKIPACP